MSSSPNQTALPLHYELMGNGQPLLCLSGFGCAHWLFKPLAHHLKSHFRLILPDNRGIGQSPGDDQPYRIADLAQDALALMERLGHATFAVAGMSMGGFIAQHLVLAAPQRVTSLVLLCTTSGGTAFQDHFTIWTEAQMANVLRMDRESYAKWILEPPISPCLKPQYAATYRLLLQQRLQHEEKPQQVMLQFKAMRHFIQEALPLSTIAAPTLVMCGSDDPVFPPINSRQLAAMIPKAQLQIFPDTDHLFFVEKSAEVGGAMRDFFRS